MPPVLPHDILLKTNNNRFAVQELIAAGLPKEQLQDLFEFHFIDKFDSEISSLLLDHGVDPNFQTRGAGGYSFYMLELGSTAYQPDMFLFEPVIIEAFYAAKYFERYEEFNQKFDLLTQKNALLDIKTKTGVPFVDLVAMADLTHRMTPEPIVAIMLKMIENKAIISENSYQKNTALYKECVHNLCGKKDRSFFEKEEFSYEAFHSLVMQ